MAGAKPFLSSPGPGGMVAKAAGLGMHGHFETEECLAGITCAALFQRVGLRTPAFLRLKATAGGEIRLAAVKLYTPEGNWDLIDGASRRITAESYRLVNAAGLATIAAFHWQVVKTGSGLAWQLTLSLRGADGGEAPPTPRTVGRLVIGGPADPFLAEAERVTFSRRNLVPGIEIAAERRLKPPAFRAVAVPLNANGAPK